MMKKIDYILVNKPHLMVINDCRVYVSGKKVGICDIVSMVVSMVVLLLIDRF